MSGSTPDLSYAAYVREAANIPMDDPDWKEKQDVLKMKFAAAIASKDSTPAGVGEELTGETKACYDLLRGSNFLTNASDSDYRRCAKNWIVDCGKSVEAMRIAINQWNTGQWQAQAQAQAATGGLGLASGGHSNVFVTASPQPQMPPSMPMSQDTSNMSPAVAHWANQGKIAGYRLKMAESRNASMAMNEQHADDHFSQFQHFLQMQHTAQFEANPFAPLGSSAPASSTNPANPLLFQMLNQQGRKPAAGFGQ
jgi:hypothetical protein